MHDMMEKNEIVTYTNDGVYEYLASISMPKKLVVSWLVTMIMAAAAAPPAAASLSTAEMSRCSFAISSILCQATALSEYAC